MKKYSRSLPIKYRQITLVLLCLYCSLGLGQKITTDVFDPTTNGKLGSIVALLGTQITENKAIIDSNDEARERLEKYLELSYGKTKYDHNTNTGRSVIRSSVLTPLMLYWGNFSGDRSNLRYLPESKWKYLRKLNQLPVADVLPAVDFNNMTTANRQKFYQLRRNIVTEEAKRSNKSLALLALFGGFLLLSGEDLNFHKTMQDFDFLN